jgi:hypothetical protein
MWVPADNNINPNTGKNSHILPNDNLALNKTPIDNIRANSIGQDNLNNSRILHLNRNTPILIDTDMINPVNHIIHRLLTNRVVRRNREAGLIINKPINKILIQVIKINQAGSNGDPNRLSHHSGKVVSKILRLPDNLGMATGSIHRSFKILKDQANMAKEEINDIRTIHKSRWLGRGGIIPTVTHIRIWRAGPMTIEVGDQAKEDKITTPLTGDNLVKAVVNHIMTIVISEVGDEKEIFRRINEIESMIKTRKKLRRK